MAKRLRTLGIVLLVIGIGFVVAGGVAYTRVNSPAELTPALGAAIDHDGPSVVHVPVVEMPDPWPFMRMTPVRGARATNA